MKDNKIFKFLFKYKIALVISLILASVGYFNQVDYSDKYNEVSNNIAATKTKIVTLNSSNKDVDTLKNDVKKLEDENTKLYNEVTDKTNKLDEINKQKQAKVEQERQAQEQAKAQAQAQESQSNSNQNTSNHKENSQTVYITPTGEKYHSRPKCGNTRSSRAVSIEEAKQSGYSPCKKCF